MYLLFCWKKYSINILETIHETNILLSGRNIKSEIDNERRKLMFSNDEERYFESQIWIPNIFLRSNMKWVIDVRMMSWVNLVS